MKNMSLEKMAQACGARYYGSDAMRGRVVDNITTDSRKVTPGSLFVAIRGERVDGHAFIEKAYEQGAVAVLGEQEPAHSGRPYLQVSSSPVAVTALAEYYRQQLPVRVVAVTGSVGKTSTKEVIASVLSRRYTVLKTAGNFNNELGLPLTIFRLREEHQIAVLEMGINHFGEMHRLSKIARPNLCVITNIERCHLEFLKDRDGVLQAKSEIFDYLAPDGGIVLNGDDDKLAQIGQVRGIRPVFYGTTGGRPVFADQIRDEGLSGTHCVLHAGGAETEVHIPVPGIHMVGNVLAATAVARQFGLTMEEIRAGVEELDALSGHFHVIETEKLRIIDDCYNANPTSMKAALDILRGVEGRKVAVLGDMGELGEKEVQMHREIGSYAAENGIDLLICTGNVSSHMAEAAMEQGGCSEVLQVPTPEALIGCLPSLVEEGDTVLVKASRFLHFERVVEKLKEI